MPITPLQTNTTSSTTTSDLKLKLSKKKKSKFSFLSSSQFFPSTSASNDDDNLDDEIPFKDFIQPNSTACEQIKPSSPPPPSSVEETTCKTTTVHDSQYNFIDEALGDPFIFYQILSYLPISSHLPSSLDMGKIFSFDYCVQYTRRELYKKSEYSLLNCMLVHSRWYEVLQQDVFYKIIVTNQFSKYFSFYYNEKVYNEISNSSSSDENTYSRFWRNILRDIVENFRWSPFISREKEYFYNYWQSKDSGLLSFISDCFQEELIGESPEEVTSQQPKNLNKPLFEMIRNESDKVYYCRGGKIQCNGKIIQAPVENIPRLKCTYQLFRTDKPILCDMIVDFQVCNLPIRKSEETIPPTHEIVNIHQDNFILLGIVDSDLLNSRGDYLSCPEQSSLVTDVMTESSSAKFNYLGEYNLQSRYRGRQREINLNLGYASNGFISYSTIIDGKFTERWRIGDIISFEIRGINSFLEKGTLVNSRKKEFASITIIRNGRFVCHVEDFMILNRMVTIRENSPNPFPKLYYFACNFYYGSVASSLTMGQDASVVSGSGSGGGSGERKDYVPAIRINRVTYL